MHCEYTVTFEDFRDSMKGYRKVSKHAEICYWLYVWILPGACLTFGVLCSVAYLRQDNLTFNALFWSACIGLGAAFGFPARYQMSLRRAFKLRNALTQDKPMFAEFDDKTIRFVVPQGAEVSYPWESFTAYFETDAVAVLFVQQAAFHTIPKRALGEEGLIQLRERVNTHARKN